MKKISKCIGAFLIALIIAISPISTNIVFAAEDTTAPQLVSAEVLSNSVKAGDSFQVKVRIKENETGLIRATIQFNDSKYGLVAAYVDTSWETPLYSSGQQYIEHIFTIPTRADFIGGDWYIGYLVLYDQKNNSSQYYTLVNSNDNKLYSDSFKPQHVVLGKTHVNVTGGTAAVPRPVVNSIKLLTPTVEKGQKLKLELSVTSMKPLASASVYMHKDDWTDQVHPEIYGMPQGAGTQKVILEIPIDNKRHIGNWEIQDIRFTDIDGNHAHYTNQLMDGYIGDYFHEAPGKFDLLKFTITGVQGDEIAPVPNSLKVLNDELSVTKPGILYLQLDLTENETGVSKIDFKYFPVIDSQESVGFIGWNSITLNPQEYNGGEDIVTRLDKPLKTGTHILEVPIPQRIPNGNYRVRVELFDGADNPSHWSTYDDVYADFIIKDEFDYKFELGVTNKELLSAVKNLNEGEVGRILLSDKSSDNIITKEILDSIANQKKKLVCYRDGYQWIFDGKKIQPHKTKDINLTTRIYVVDGKYLSSGKQAIALSFENNGKLPGNIEFRFKSTFIRDYFGREELLKLYHVQHPETGYEADIDYIQSDYAKIPDNQAMFKIVLENSKDAWCSVNLNHNSKYVISDTELTRLSEKQAANLQAQSNNNNQSSKPVTTIGSNSASSELTVSEDSGVSSELTESQENNRDPASVAPKKMSAIVVIIIVLACALVLGIALALTFPKSRAIIKEFINKYRLK